jgi:hypothetical protein
MMWIGLVSEMLDFTVHLTQPSARENFIEILIFGYLYLNWHRLSDFARSVHKRKMGSLVLLILGKKNMYKYKRQQWRQYTIT